MAKRPPGTSPANPDQETRAMPGPDAEIEQLRRISCAALLEYMPPPWRLDQKESTRRAVKYRRGKGEVLIVNHEGHGWWDPLSEAKGDVISLVQHLNPGLNLGQVRKALRPLVGLQTAQPKPFTRERICSPDVSVSERWNARPRLSTGSAVWRYLSGTRALPAPVLAATEKCDVVREGPHGNAWFAHRGFAGHVTHVEIRGPEFRSSLRGGTKTLFRFPGGAALHRLAVAEAPIDALSLAALEGIRSDTLYVATGGGMGNGSIFAIELLLAGIVEIPGAVLVSATDANTAGERFAARHAELAAAAAVAFERLTPTLGTDWNDVLAQGGTI